MVVKRLWAPTETSSDEYEYAGARTLEKYLAGIDRNRQAAGNKLPMPWPYVTGPVSAKAHAIAARIEGNVKKVMQNHNIQLSGYQVTLLQRKGLRAAGKETLIIQTNNDDSLTQGYGSWWDAANEIQELVDEEVRQAKYYEGSIVVEIRNENLMVTNVSGVVPSGTAAFQALTSMREEVIAETRKCAIGVGPISFVMRGKRFSNKFVPTVLVGIYPGTVGIWTYSYDRIIAVIEKFNNDVELEFLPEIVQPVVSLEPAEPKGQIYVGLDQLPATARNGASIGPRGAEKAGSLGVWIWFTQPGKPRTIAFLTCYHVIRTGEKDAKKLEYNDRNGIGLKGSVVARDEQIIVDYPAPFDCKTTEKALKARIAAGRAVGVSQSVLDTIERYRKYPGIGRVAIASGMQRKNRFGKSMDWAVVVIGSSGPNPGQNRPISEERTIPAVGATSAYELAGIEYDVGPNETISAVGGTPQNQQVILKLGRSTAATAGNYNGIKCNMRWTHKYENDDPENGAVLWEEVTDEHQWLAFQGQVIATGGDSGAMIMNLEKEWVGILTNVETSANSLYFTLAQDIINDIEDRAGCRISLPR